ncbi:innexin inx3-like [Planococcus citri]|uniref:innexin inx3-like n=1 Tax=Planococcus citri TaxID=170843 RepID=UPI0031F8D803
MPVSEISGNFEPLIKVRNVRGKAIIDNKIFQLHYRVTTLIFFICWALVTACTTFGHAITCTGSSILEKDEIQVANIFCYSGVKNRYNPSTLSVFDEEPEDSSIFAYRWVPKMLFLQVILFYLTRWIWKYCEGKKLDHLMEDLKGPVVESQSARKERFKCLAKYAADSLHTHNTFAWIYYLCEILNFINVILNIFWINSFLSGEFINYGLREDPNLKVFPRLANCDYRKYGDSGVVQKHSLVCVLGFNVLNEKIYLFLWFWLILLACVSILPIVHNIAVLISPTIRKRELEKHYVMFDENSSIDRLVQKTQIGDVFLWDLFGKNMSSKCYREFIHELYECLIGARSSQNKNHEHTERSKTGENVYELDSVNLIREHL